MVAFSDVTPGGLALPAGTRIADVLPAVAGRRPAVRGGRGVRTAPGSGRGTLEGPLISYQAIYDTTAVVAAVVNKIAHNFARVPWIVERRGAKRWERVPDDHALVRLLEQPAPGLGPMALKLWLAFGLLIEGNAVIYQHRAVTDGPPTELYPLDWRHLIAYRQAGGMVDRWISTELGASKVIDHSEVLHLAWWSQGGAAGQIGLAPLEQLGTTIQSDDAAERHSYAALANGPHWSGAFQLPHDVELTPAIAQDLRTVLDAWEGSPDTHGGTPILARGAEYKTFQQTAKDAALIETRHANLERVCMVYDTSPTVIGILRAATQRGNVAELNRDFFGNTLTPPLALAAEAVNTQVIGAYEPWRAEGLRVRPDVSEFVRGDPAEWDRIINERIRNGRLPLNEAREMDGTEPYDDPKADEAMVADNNFHPLSQVGEPTGGGDGA